MHCFASRSARFAALFTALVGASIYLGGLAGCGSSSAPAADPGDASSADVADAPTFPAADAVSEDASLDKLASSTGSLAFGKTYKQWSEAYWQWLLPIAKAISPLTGGDCTQGQSGPVWFLTPGSNTKPNVRSCTVPSSAAIMFPLVTTLCYPCPEDDTTCAIPTAEKDLRKCANDYLSVVDSMQVIVDGKSVGKVSDFILYRVQSDLFTWKAPAARAQQVLACTGPVPKNDCMVPVGDRNGISDGYWLILKPLPPGPHTIYWGAAVVPASDPAFKASIAYDLTVTP